MIGNWKALFQGTRRFYFPALLYRWERVKWDRAALHWVKNINHQYLTQRYIVKSYELVDKNMQLSLFMFDVGFDLQDALLVRDIHLYSEYNSSKTEFIIEQLNQ